MRKILYVMNVSLDGYIEDPAGTLDWSFPSPELHQHFNDWDRTIDTYLYGRKLYENMAAYWPTADQDPRIGPIELEFARQWKTKRKIVFSTTLKRVGWNSELFRGDLLEGVRRLKEQPGLDMNVGGAGLGASFLRLGLVDEVHLYTRPVLLGGGKPMFPANGPRMDLKLLEMKQFEGGVVMTRYGKK